MKVILGNEEIEPYGPIAGLVKVMTIKIIPDSINDTTMLARIVAILESLGKLKFNFDKGEFNL